jgi:molybdopterin converting factor subunit 1
MRVRVLLFAILRDRAGVSEVALDLPQGATVAAAAEAVFGRFPELRGAARSLAYAVNRAYCPPDAALKDADEVALIPPVSGG